MASGEAAAVIGKSVQIRGEVKGNEDLVVEGLVEGTITLSGNRLTVGPHARVQANVVGRDVIVQGILDGDVVATGRVELRAGSQMAGNIRAARLSVEDNAIYSGKVELDGTGTGGDGGKAATAASGSAAASTSAGAR
jgi:cytoskeletal protein CcmA (bactofilin family)